MNSPSPVRMRAAVLTAPARVEVDDFPIPDLEPGDVLVRMTRASICGSDLHVVYDGFAGAFGKPGYPGHEGIGLVAESRSAEFRAGQVVLTVPTGLGGRCFATHQVVPEAFLVPLPDDADTDRLLFAQQLGTTIYAMRKFWPRDPVTNETPAGLEPLEPRCAVVIGAGSAGLFFVQLARRQGFEKIVVSDPSSERRRLALELGATDVADGTTEQLLDATQSSSGGRGADLVIEAAGYDLCRDQAIQAVRPRGRVGCFGYPEKPGLAPFPVQLCFRKAPTIEFTVGTQREPGLRSFREAVQEIQRGTLEVDYCRGTGFDIEHAPEALAVAQARGPAVKVSIDLEN
ncbi:MAG: zinc-binding dehydrogenase [Candidatus Dormibacteraeota bacterium]|nr:zinc-binding dehydrogenase [Candidatus Dormibacteraeota bacterium]